MGKCRKYLVNDVLNPTAFNISNAIKINFSVEISTEFPAHVRDDVSEPFAHVDATIEGIK